MPASAEPFLLRPRDPLIVRDARPFAADPGARAVTLPWPLPGTIAGALRGHVGNGLGFDWTDPARQADARTIALTGFFRVARRAGGDRWNAYLPAPRDAVPYVDPDDKTPKLMCLRPLAALPEGADCTRPEGASSVPPVDIAADVKPESAIDAWSLGDVIAWLAAPYSVTRPHDVLGLFLTETRTHVKIDYGRGAADPGFLFSTEGLAFAPAPMIDAETKEIAPETAMLCRLATNGFAWEPATAFVPLGGERRQSILEPLSTAHRPDPDPFVVPLEIARRLGEQQGLAKRRLRLLLVTPGFFDAGWLPGGLSGGGRIARLLGGARLTLRGAVIDRRVAVSGWDLVKRGPKATRYAVPAGSVYFFELDRDLTAEDVAALWLQPISDGDQDCTDGYGLAVPGLWSPEHRHA